MTWRLLLKRTDVECLCKLMTTIGKVLDHAKACPYMEACFAKMTQMSKNVSVQRTSVDWPARLPSILHPLFVLLQTQLRMRFMLMDVVDLRARL